VHAPRRARLSSSTLAVALLLSACTSAPSAGASFVLSGPTPATSVGPSVGPTSTFVRPTLPPPDAALEVVTTGLDTPVGLVPYPGRSGIDLVWEQTGTIRVLQDGTLRPGLFLDLRSRLVKLLPDYDERGLLGFAFHPDFAHDGRVFAYYAAPTRPGATGDHTDRLSEFRVDPAHPLQVVPGSEQVILEFEQPQFNHMGGGLGFGPDGDLYLGTGDGGGEGDASPGHSPQGNAQDPMKLNGKILRIDVDHPGTDGRSYAIPADNPYASGVNARGAAGRPEVYALGLRNPWRLTWEPDGEHRLLASDVGYGRYEEIDVIVKGGNYGWRIREGAHCLDLEHPLDDSFGCATTAADGAPLIDPVVEYTHKDIGIAVVGGFVYEGAALPALRGQYVFGDLTSQWTGATPTARATILAAQPQPAGTQTWPWRPLSLQDGRVTSFITGIGQEADGELDVLVRDVLGPVGGTGRILRLVPPG
jgi:glucose/arabinose dehydrogenase